MKKLLRLCLIGFAFLTTCFLAMPDSNATVLYDRGLPVSLSDTYPLSLQGTPAFYPGDDFALAPGNYNLSKITVWVVGTPGASALYGGVEGGTQSLLSTVSATSNAGLLSGTQIYQIDFTVNWDVVGGTVYSFYVMGGDGTISNTISLAASNSALGDGYVLWSNLQSPSFEFATDSASVFGLPSSADFDVRVEGTAVPEPSSLILIVSGFGSLFLLRRKTV